MMFRHRVIALFLWLSAAPARAECVPARIADIVTPVADAERAFREMRAVPFREATDGIVGILPCVVEPIPPSTAAAIHRMVGLRAFMDEDPERVGLAFGAARAVDPTYAFPHEFLLPNNPVAIAYLAIPGNIGHSEPVPAPVEGYFQFDGQRSLLRPATFPTVAQLFGSNGAIRSTTYLWPGDALPDYAAAPKPPAARGPRPQRALFISALGTGVVASALYGLALSNHAAWDHAPTVDDANRFRIRANTLGATALAAGGVTAGLAVAGVVVWVR